MGSVGDGFIVVFRAHRVCRMFLYLYSVEALKRYVKSARLHVFNLIFENQMIGLLVVDFVGEVHEDCVGADVGVLGRVYTCEVLIFDEYWAVCRRQWSQREWTLDVVTR